MTLSAFIQILLLVWALFSVIYFKDEIKEFVSKKPKANDPQDNLVDEIDESDFVGRVDDEDFDLSDEEPIQQNDESDESEQSDDSNDEEDYQEHDSEDFSAQYEETEPIPQHWIKEMQIEILSLQTDENTDAEIDHSGVEVELIEESVNEVYNPTSEEASKEAVKVIDDLDETALIESLKTDDVFLASLERIRAIAN